MRSLRFSGLYILMLLILTNDAYPFLKRQGCTIIDSQGQKILLRGLGLGGWLVQEGYQLHIPGPGSPSDIRNKIVALVGEEKADQFYQKYIANYVTENDIEAIAGWGFNSIRLPFNYRLLTPENQPHVYLEDGFQIIDQLLDWCEKYQLYLILDMHCAPGGQNKDNISDCDGVEARLWTQPVNQTRTIEIWKKIAERYAQEEWIGGYDLLNEPVLPTGHASSELRLLYMNITQAIRQVDTNHIIFIEGNWYATDFTSLTPIFDTNLVYSFHKYWNENTPASIASYLNLRNTTSCPLWLGESGENSNPWFNDVVRLMEKNDIGWNWWTHKKIATTTSPYSSPISPLYQRVLDYWNGTAAKPSTEVAFVALMQMADDLLLEKCDYRPDVVDALLRPDFNTAPVPYKIHSIPGDIPCAEYDMGQVTIAYQDADYQKVRGLQSGEQWNRGSTYRNDGVDIELSTDPLGATYNIGWIEDNEWLLYSVNIDQGGTYAIECRVSSPNSTGQFQLTCNNLTLTAPVSVPNTGGWKSWQTISTPDIQLTAGNCRLKLLVIKGNFNINLLRFRLKSSDTDDSTSGDIPSRIDLSQNFPNPFNNATQIRFSMPQPEQVCLNIFNAQGELVRTLMDEFLNSGQHTVIWNGTDAYDRSVSSGVYFYRIQATHGNRLKSMTLIK